MPLVNSVITPLGVMRPIAGAVVERSVNQMFPSGSAAIPKGTLPAGRPLLNSVTAPPMVISPIALTGPSSVNQMFPSGPAATAGGALGVLPGLPPFAARLYSVIAPVAG
jgi:hypothetical protein